MTILWYINITMEDHHFSWGKLPISMAIFKCYVKLPEGIHCLEIFHCKGSCLEIGYITNDSHSMRKMIMIILSRKIGLPLAIIRSILVLCPFQKTATIWTTNF